MSPLVFPQIEVWLQEVGWPGVEEPGEPSLDTLLQAQGPFQELDLVAQVSLVICSFCRYWATLPGAIIILSDWRLSSQWRSGLVKGS